MFDDSRIVFINFAVGSFGSFLWHTLAQSKTSYHSSLLENTFDEHGTAHNGLSMCLRHFHRFDEVDKWLQLDSDDRKQAIHNNWEDPTHWDENNKLYVHRITTPQFSSEILKTCPNSKLIIIDFDEDDIPLIASMLGKKIMIPMQLSQGNMPPEFFIKRMAFDMVKNSFPEKNVEGAYYFKFKSFLDESSFIDEFNKLCKWLNFEVPDITEWYKEFKRVNNL